jgi:hypothetical protein
MYILYVIFLTLAVNFFINHGLFFSLFGLSRPIYDQKYQLKLIEFLTQQKTREKNYENPPNEYKDHGRLITGEIIDETSAVLYYNYPLVGNIENDFIFYADVKTVSQAVDKFGGSSKYLYKDGDNYKFHPTSDMAGMINAFNKDGFFMNQQKMGIDYNYLLHHSGPIGKQIADDILKQLQNLGLDNRENRVISACNFVQFIPYGQPEFDKGKDIYFGLSIPYESLILSFCDCDSKSLLLATILFHLIDYNDIIFVGCDLPEGAHMILGVSGLNLNGLKYRYKGIEYMLIETTVPHNIEELEYDNIKITDIYPVKSLA